MGQAAVDLPDPTKDLSTAHAGGADDLLAQLAGDEIDRLLAESDVEPEPQPEPVAKLTPASKIEEPTTASVTDAAKPIASTTHLVIPTEVAMSSPVAATAESSAISQTHGEAIHESHDATASIPTWLKPLLWLNAPLNALPDPLRELIGKIAIATSANALAVLGYVALFRHHH